MLILSGYVKHHNAFHESSPYTICGGCLSCAEGGGMVWCLIPQKKLRDLQEFSSQEADLSQRIEWRQDVLK